MKQCSSCGGFCKKSGCDLDNTPSLEDQRDIYAMIIRTFVLEAKDFTAALEPLIMTIADLHVRLKKIEDEK